MGVGVGVGMPVAGANPTAVPVMCRMAISFVKELGKKTDLRLLKETGPLVGSLQSPAYAGNNKPQAPAVTT